MIGAIYKSATAAVTGRTSIQYGLKRLKAVDVTIFSGSYFRRRERRVFWTRREE